MKSYLFENRNRKFNYKVNNILYNVDIYLYKLTLIF